MMLTTVPCALVERLFLAPDKIMYVGVRFQRFLNRFVRERVELFNAHNGDIFLIVFTTLFQQVVINLTRTHHHALHALRIELINLANRWLEGAVGQFVQAGDRQRMTQQRLRRHNNQRAAHTAQRLTTQHVVNLRRGGRDANLHVLLSAKLQITFQTRGGVLRPLPFVAVRQQHHQAAHPPPFLLAGGDELIDHHLRAVGEVAELRFPDGQGARFSGRIAVFERQHRFFRQDGVPDAEGALTVMNVLQRRIRGTICLVMNHRMTVEEGAATGVLAGQTHRNPLINQRGVGQRFRAAPVEQLLASGHRLTIAVNFGDARLHFYRFRHRADAFSQFLQTLHFHLVRVALIPFMVEVRRPGEGVHVHRTPLFHHAFACIQRIAVEVDHFSGVFQRSDLVRFQLVGVEFTRRRMLFDFLVHQRLGCARLVGFVMAVTAVAHQIDEDIAFKGITEVQRQTGNESHRFRVIRVNVENRRLNHLADVGAVWGGTRIQRVGGGKAHLVVDDDTHRTAHFVTTRLGHVQGFLNHALARHCGVAVNGDWQHFIAARLIQTIQTGAHGTDHHRADDFQVRRVKRQRQVNQTAFGFDIRREAHVVLHVAGAEMLFMFARKFVEQILRFFTQHVDQHVQTTTVRHTQHHFAGAAVARMADHLFEHRD